MYHAAILLATLSLLANVFGSLATNLSISPRISPLKIPYLSDIRIGRVDCALNLLRSVGGENETTVLSPFSITEAFATLYLGAAGETRSSIRRVFGGNSTDSDFTQYVSKELHQLSATSDSSKHEFYAASGLYYADRFALRVDNDSTASLHSIDVADPVGSAQLINAWIRTQTNGKIGDLIQNDTIDGLTRLLIVNAVYFKGEWAVEFQESLTHTQPFFGAVSTRHVNMMKKTGKFDYFADANMQILGVPYKAEEVEMFLLLPTVNKADALPQCLNALNGEQLLQYIHHVRRINVQVNIPKFTIKQGWDLSLPLSTIGLKTVFSDQADFRGLCTEDVKISKVLHKSFIEINEAGTEAAAASGAAVMLRAAPGPTPPPPKFIANHPFIFAVVKNDNILFIGKFQ